MREFEKVWARVLGFVSSSGQRLSIENVSLKSYSNH